MSNFSGKGPAFSLPGPRRDLAEISTTEISPWKSDTLVVGQGHELHVEHMGLSSGPVVIHVHGGPGFGLRRRSGMVIGPEFHSILYDQRGCGKSLPALDLRNNSTDLLVQDLSLLIAQQSIPRPLLFGGSWGATLSLAFAARHCESISGLVLRAPFLGTSSAAEYFLHQSSRAATTFPEEYQRFASFLKAPAHTIAGARESVALCDSAAGAEFSLAFIQWNAKAAHYPDALDLNYSYDHAIATTKLFFHYLSNDFFMSQGGIIPILQSIPAESREKMKVAIIQGESDLITPSSYSKCIANLFPGSDFYSVPRAGHALDGAPMISACRFAFEKLLLDPA
jgi:proline iminopeptidase